MENRWSEQRAAEFVSRYAERWGEDLALRTYSSRLIGSDPGLVLHGGGNTSVKGVRSDVFGERVEVLFVKASGRDLAHIEPDGHVAVELLHLRRLCGLSELSDPVMVNEVRTHLLDHGAPTPSIEAPVHAVLPGLFVDHAHADAVLALTNRDRGEATVREALGDEVAVLPYALPGFQLSRQVAGAVDEHPDARAMVWMRHGIVTWGETARASYELLIELVSRAEAFLARSARRSVIPASRTSVESAEERLARVAPVARGLLATPTGNPDRPFRRVVLRPLIDREVLDCVDWDRGRELALSPPLTSDHLIRTKVLPAWVAEPDYGDEGRLRSQLQEVLGRYTEEYQSYLARHAARMPPGVDPFDPLPRVMMLPGLGALCAGRDAHAANIARDITERTLAAKRTVAAMGASYRGLEEEHLFDMEYRSLQHAKLESGDGPPLGDHVTVVTGAAGAIGSGICEALLESGAHVAVTDLPGPNLEQLAAELARRFPERVTAVSLDVSDPESVAEGLAAVVRSWGGVDQLVINAGLAHVSTLSDMQPEHFRRLERVNTEGALLLLGQAGRLFERQGTGGDIVLVSTKNVFAPGAGFGAYSATKAAAHQLARIASLELAGLDVRVNMVSPDAVFSHGDRPSGLWAEVGPGRMRARGLDAEGLREYYRERNLLKARITAEHVARAVLYFLTRQTPTTGATLPVDGGLPDATPR
jgi:rhamnose utilization protein RhaD (predicted bifunctional aldolase and dehydrogenase)/NAD(P)-dependent dehydrogenase (short-subunit alcohol dehydrogenase family)